MSGGKEMVGKALTLTQSERERERERERFLHFFLPTFLKN